MIFNKLVVGSFGTNCYIFGSDNKIIIIDPGAEPEYIIKNIEQRSKNIEVIGVVFTHGHFDHTMNAENVINHFKTKVMFCEKQNSHFSSNIKPDVSLSEGDIIELDDIKLHVLETPGHSPESISLYTTDVKNLNGKDCDGIIFTGDLLFRRSVGRTDFPGGDPKVLMKSIKEKIMQNPNITNDFFVFPGHMGNTTVGEERKLNMFKDYFL